MPAAAAASGMARLAEAGHELLRLSCPGQDAVHVVVDEARLTKAVVDPIVGSTEQFCPLDGVSGVGMAPPTLAQGTRAMTRAGPPEPPVSLSTPTTTHAPSGGSWARFVRFSRCQTPLREADRAGGPRSPSDARVDAQRVHAQAHGAALIHQEARRVGPEPGKRSGPPALA